MPNPVEVSAGQGRLFEDPAAAGILLESGTEQLLPDPGQLVPQEIIAPAADARVRAHYLIEALSNLAVASRSGGFTRAGRGEKRAELEVAYGPLYPEDGVGMGDEVAHKGRSSEFSARANFKIAYELGIGAVEEDDPGLIISFGQFYQKFAGKPNRKARDRRRDNLRRLAAIPGENKGGDRYMPEPEAATVEGVVPEAAEPATTAVEVVPDLRTLRTAERLRALHGDPRAGFLPATSREQNQALTLLDYLGNRQYPAGVGNQLQEVFLHQTKNHGGDVSYGQRALLSIGFELGDYFNQASGQALALQTLAELVDECPNPDISLMEAVGDTHDGFAPLVRYLDVLELARTGRRPNNETLQAHARREGPQEYDDQNKTVEDAYTALEVEQSMEHHIIERASTLSVGELRGVIEQAAGNEERRAAFWQDRLYDTFSHSAAWRAGKQVLEHHGLPLNPRQRVA